MKKIMIVWTIVLIIIVGGLTFLGFKMKEKNIYDVLESSLVEQGKKYLGLYPGLYPSSGKTLRITNEELIEDGYDPKLEKDCVGYLEVTASQVGYDYKGFINCPDYKTEGFEEK